MTSFVSLKRQPLTNKQAQKFQKTDEYYYYLIQRAKYPFYYNDKYGVTQIKFEDSIPKSQKNYSAFSSKNPQRISKQVLAIVVRLRMEKIKNEDLATLEKGGIDDLPPTYEFPHEDTSSLKTKKINGLPAFYKSLHEDKSPSTVLQAIKSFGFLFRANKPPQNLEQGREIKFFENMNLKFLTKCR
jgi:hypothetical protein